MIAAWMMYATLVAALAAAAALFGERALRLIGLSGRWIWLVAIGFTCLLPLIARPLMREQTVSRPLDFAAVDPVSDVVMGQHGSTQIVRLPRTIAIPAGTSLSMLDRPLIVVWLTGSISWCVLLIASMRAVARRRVHWTPSLVDGTPVLISHSTGPALVGAFAPDIVLPAWLLEMPSDQRALVIAHEREHARARDTLLLLVAAISMTLMPWNVALWFAFGRLRLAVELDCDTRVLRAHPDVRRYGALLVEVSERSLRATLPMAALVESDSHLTRRIEFMSNHQTRFVLLRLAGASILSSILVAAACAAPRPSASSATELRAANERANARNYRDNTRIPDSAMLRRAVLARYPTALNGGMGAHPTVWFLADAADSVIRSATGRAVLSRTPEGEEALDWNAVTRAFPGVPGSMKPGGVMSASGIGFGSDTVDVIWVRVSGDTNRK
jgi:beta-lactamase regulating signal transducer with metallopeptidase domain